MKRSILFVLFFWIALACRAEQALPEPEAMAYFNEQEPRRHLSARLYRAGAIYVGVIEGKDGAAGLKVYLPYDKQERAVIFLIANEVLSQYGYRTEEDEGQDILKVWFKVEDNV